MNESIDIMVGDHLRYTKKFRKIEKNKFVYEKCEAIAAATKSPL